MIACHFIIAGHVQGVAFRGHVVAEARKYLLTGWVRNVRNGTVEVLAQGAREDVEALLRWCRHGPPAATVTGLTITEIAPDPALQTFERRASI